MFDEIEVVLVRRSRIADLDSSERGIVDVLVGKLRRELERGLRNAEDGTDGDDHCLVFHPWKGTFPLVDANADDRYFNR